MMMDYGVPLPNDGRLQLRDVSNKLNNVVRKRKRVRTAKRKMAQNKTLATQDVTTSFVDWNAAPVVVKRMKEMYMYKCECQVELELSEISVHVYQHHKRSYIISGDGKEFLMNTTSSKEVAHDHGYALLMGDNQTAASAIKCIECDFSASTWDEVHTHMNNNHKTGGFVCRVCSSRFLTIKELQSHQCNIVDCLVCESRLPSLQLLHKHLNEVHSLFLCYCGFIGGHPEMHDHHCQGTPPPNVPPQDSPSGMSLATVNINSITPLLRMKSKPKVQHARKSLPTKFKEMVEEESSAYACPLCGFVVFQYESFLNHNCLSGNPNNILFSCEICSYVCHGLIATEYHMLGHHNEINEHDTRDQSGVYFNCPMCTFVSNNIVVRDEHAVGHKRNLSSSVCPFPSDSDLELLAYCKDLFFQCDKCSLKFRNVEDRKNHIAEFHAKSPSETLISNQSSEHKKSCNNGSEIDLDSSSTILNCKRCNFTCSDKLIYLQHVQNHFENVSPKYGVFSCAWCSYKTENKSFLEKHEYIHMGYDTVFSCTKCFFFSPDFRTYSNHVCPQKDSASTYFTCLECRYTVTSMQLYKRHTHDNVRLKCDKCYFWCHESIILKYHKAENHSSEPELKRHKSNSSPELDNVCNTVLKSTVVKHLNGSKVTLANESAYNCFLCSFTCKSREDMNKHCLVHSSEKVLFYSEITVLSNQKSIMFSCSFCSFSTKYITAIKNHATNHISQQESRSIDSPTTVDEECVMICNHCNFSSSNAIVMKEHEAMHVAQSVNSNKQKATKQAIRKLMIFSCCICSYTSDDEKDMKRHSQAHIKEGNQKQDGGDGMEENTTVLSSQKSNAAAEPKDDTSKSIYNCSLCNYTSQDVLDIQRHSLAHLNGSVDQPEKVKVICGICNFSTYNQEEWKSHEKQHSDKPEETKEKPSAVIRPVKLSSLLKPSVAKEISSSPIGNAVPPWLSGVPSLLQNLLQDQSQKMILDTSNQNSSTYTNQSHPDPSSSQISHSSTIAVHQNSKQSHPAGQSPVNPMQHSISSSLQIANPLTLNQYQNPSSSYSVHQSPIISMQQPISSSSQVSNPLIFNQYQSPSSSNSLHQSPIISMQQPISSSSQVSNPLVFNKYQSPSSSYSSHQSPIIPVQQPLSSLLQMPNSAMLNPYHNRNPSVQTSPSSTHLTPTYLVSSSTIPDRNPNPSLCVSSSSKNPDSCYFTVSSPSQLSDPSPAIPSQSSFHSFVSSSPISSTSRVPVVSSSSQSNILSPSVPSTSRFSHKSPSVSSTSQNVNGQSPVNFSSPLSYPSRVQLLRNPFVPSSSTTTALQDSSCQGTGVASDMQPLVTQIIIYRCLKCSYSGTRRDIADHYKQMHVLK